MRRLAPLAAALALAGCTVGPNYKAGTPAPPSAFAGPQRVGPPPEVDLARWWTAFDDPELARLIAIGLRQAPDLQTAASRVRQARFAIVQARALGLPQINASASPTYTRLSKNAGFSSLASSFGGGAMGGGGAAGGGAGGGGASGGSGSSSGIGLPGSGFGTYSLGFDASWEIDLFGGVRRQVEEARANLAAAEWDARDARVQLAAEIASDYLQLRGYQRQAAIARAEAERQDRSLQLIAHTAQAGLTPDQDTIRQRTQLATSRARVAPLEAQALAQIDAVAVLLGMAPEELIVELKVERPLPPVPPLVPPGLPADLVRRRPDVRAAERRLAAQTAAIGVAVADLYPRLTLTGMASLVSTALGNLFQGDSLMLTAAGQATFPILDFGTRRAQVDIAREQREQAYIQWRQTVLGALRDVEDALVRFEGERRSNVELSSGVADAGRSLKSVEAQYRVGLIDLQPVLDGQQQLLTVQDNLAQSDVRLRQDVAALYKALGGGWSDADPPPLRPDIVDQPKGGRHD
ncbi:efflux transporter outer membrane subunit [Sphingomonas sp.]|uniref:efflux transporter outer membrane subunit n=1 Tax=Sphingomonas sp. TaxID=28214 RepID=UPI003B00922E